MEKSFSVSVPVKTRALQPDKHGKTEVTYTVTNNKSNPVRGRMQVATKDGGTDWFSISGDTERDFSAEESQQYKVLVAVPAETPAGSYSFRLDAVNVANPQEDFTEGDTVSFDWQPDAPPKKMAMWMWLVPVCVVGLMLLIALVAMLWKPEPDEIVAKSATITTQEDQPYKFKVTDFVAESLAEKIAKIKITELPGKGVLQLTEEMLTIDQEIPIDKINGNQLVFEPAQDGNGSEYASFKFVVSGVNEESSQPGTISIDVTAVNDLPVGDTGRVGTQMDKTYTFKTKDFRFEDVDEGDQLTKIKIVDLPQAGILKLAGAEVKRNAEIGVEDINSNKFSFVPDESSMADFSFKVHDGKEFSTTKEVMIVRVDAPGPVEVPPLKNKPLDVARRTIVSKNLKVGQISYKFDGKNNNALVLEQLPAERVLVQQDTAIDLTVSIPNWKKLEGEWEAKASSGAINFTFNVKFLSNGTYILDGRMKLPIVSSTNSVGGSGKWIVAPSRKTFRYQTVGIIEANFLEAELDDGKFPCRVKIGGTTLNLVFSRN